MTMPDGRTRNLLQAGAFLREVEADTELPNRVRCEAHRLSTASAAVQTITRVSVGTREVFAANLSLICQKSLHLVNSMGQ